MLEKPLNFLYDLRDRQRMIIALSRGAAMMAARKVDLGRPATWEFSGFSQNGEDGILDVLRGKLATPNRYFVEIGASDGIENNSAWLLVAEKYGGIMIEGDPELAKRANRVVVRHSIGAQCRAMFVTRDNVPELKALSLHDDPDVFSLDIDGNDYYVAQAILDCGFRPKIFVVEYNSVYGPDRCMTIEYRENFVFTTAHPTHLYYGVGVSAWRKLFESRGYRFVTVERNGVNAFFVDPSAFEPGFLPGVKPLEFAENRYKRMKFGTSTEEQFALIADQPFVSV
jgi:hypothetical protein